MMLCTQFLYLVAMDQSVAELSAKGNIVSSMKVAWENSSKVQNEGVCVNVNFVVIEAFQELGVCLAAQVKKDDIPALAEKIYAAIEKKHGDDFSICTVYQDKPFSLEEVIDGFLSKEYPVQLSQDSHFLHGVEMSPFGNYLHDLFHIIAVHVMPSTSRLHPLYKILQKVLDDLANRRHLDEISDANYKTCICALFLMLHESFSEKATGDEEYRIFKLMDLYSLLDILCKLPVTRSKKMVFCRDEKNDIRAYEDILKELNLSEGAQIARITPEYLICVVKAENEHFYPSVEYLLLEARDRYWRLKYCGGNQDLEAPDEVQKKDHDSQIDWLRRLYDLEDHVKDLGFLTLKRLYGSNSRSPIAKQFKLVSDEFFKRLEIIDEEAEAYKKLRNEEHSSSFEAKVESYNRKNEDIRRQLEDMLRQLGGSA